MDSRALTMSRRSMARRMRTAAVLEAFNAGWLALLIFGVAGAPLSVANLVGYGVLAVLLLEAAAYWTLKHRQLRSHARCPPGLAGFRVLRPANVSLLAAALVVIVIATIRQPGADTWPGAGFWLFGLVEHVNYFHVQLSHQTRADLRRLVRTRRFRRAHLATDLARCRRQ
jgi:hypothetical protein